MAGETPLEAQEATLEDGSRMAYYTKGTPPETYVFSTESLAKDVVGYGGPLVLAVHIDADGTLRQCRVLTSRETPSYLAPVRRWIDGLSGRNLFSEAPFGSLDGVSGATVTSRAVLDTLSQAVPAFARQVLGRDVGERRPAPKSGQGGASVLWLIAAFTAALLLRHYPSPGCRKLFLAAVIAVLGGWFNVQYSSQHVMALLSLQWPPIRFAPGFAAIVLLPVATVLFGNLYCGYVCPFGAIQEWAGELRRNGLEHAPSQAAWRYGRRVKYLLLFLVVTAFALTRDTAVLSADPLTTLFSPWNGHNVLRFAGGLVVLSIFYPRFWCRTLCPAGPFCRY